MKWSKRQTLIEDSELKFLTHLKIIRQQAVFFGRNNVLKQTNF